MTTNELNKALNSIDPDLIQRSCDRAMLSECFKQQKKKNIQYSVKVFSIFFVLSLFIYSGMNMKKVSDIIPNNNEVSFNTEYKDSEQNVTDASAKDEDLEEISAGADLTVIYQNDIEKIKDKSLLVVSGNVIKSETYYNDPNYMPMTLNTLAVSKVFSDIEIPDIIYFFEPGAKLNVDQTKMFVGPERDKSVKEGIEFTLDGYKHCNVGDEVILFLAKGSSYPDLDEKENFEYTYYTAGLIQGKLILNNGIYQSATPSSLDAEYSEYTLDSFTDFYQKMR